MSFKSGSIRLRVAVDLEVQRHQLKSPDNNAHRTYNIYLLNDNYTSPEFIISILRRYFYMGSMEAIGLMLEIRQAGRGKCGQYTFEIAEIKVMEINELAKRNQYPLLCIMEENVLVNA